MSAVVAINGNRHKRGPPWLRPLPWHSWVINNRLMNSELDCSCSVCRTVKVRKSTDAYYHRLHSSASLMLKATDLGNGRWQFSTPTESTPLNRSPKICYKWLRQLPLRLCQIWYKSVRGGFWANGWNITKFLFIYLYFIFGNSQVTPVDGFSRLILQTMRTCAKMCRGLFDFAAHFGVKSPPKKLQFWGHE